jgi:aspartyl-tRNA(Asn)/glutamyl-tRNA(Gln) amidotransferase subunit B
VRDLGLTAYAAQVLTQHPRVAAFFEEAAARSADPARVANFVQSEVLRDVSTHGPDASIPVTAAQVAELLRLVEAGTISGKQAKELYLKLKERGPGALAAAVAAELGLAQVSDPGEIEAVCTRVVADNPKQAEQLRAGKSTLFGFFVGQVMKATRGSANPQLVNDTLRRLLEPS